MPVINRIAAFADDLTEWRRDLHAHPEIGLQEFRTSAVVAEKLRSWGIEVTTGIAGTGLVGTLRRGSSTRAIGIRADMDALPMDEANTFAHRSQNPGRMHACGHDGHTTMLLGAARYLAETGNFDGTVHFIFQPAEENEGGGRIMVEEGLFQRFPCEMVFGAHNDTSLPKGTMAVVEGSVSAASDRLNITITGRGGHAARPHRTIDPVVVGSHIVLALQSIVARRTDPLDSAVISITQFHAGSAHNVIPDSATLAGTVRTLLPRVQDEVERLIPQMVHATAAAHGAEAVVALRAWDLLSAPERQEARKQEQAEGPHGKVEDIAFFPLTLPFTTGPGTIAVAVALGAGRPETGPAGFFIGMSAAALTIAIIVWLCYRSADRVGEFIGTSARRTISRLSAFLLLCIGAQIMIAGLLDVAALIRTSA